MTGRTVKEWIGKTPDAKIPPRVRLRVFEAHGGICHISGRKITAADQWDMDHIIPLKDGGEHLESNLAPAIRALHRKKTSAENSARKVTRRKKMKAIGIKKKARNPLPGSKAHPSGLSRRIDGTVVKR